MDHLKTESIHVLGIRVDKINLEQATAVIGGWVEHSSLKHYVVTPNPEFILEAQSNFQFRQALNQADLSLPDSSRLGWAQNMLKARSIAKKIPYLFGCLFPKLINPTFPVTTGTDLVVSLSQLSSKKAFTIGLIGGRAGVARKAADCLIKRYPGLKVAFAQDGPEVDSFGKQFVSYQIPSETDILFVAFGQVKQELWIADNLEYLPVKVAIGVGGAFDYISEKVARAPKWLRDLGFEWFYRLLIQPWRLGRQLKLVKFVWLVLIKS